MQEPGIVVDRVYLTNGSNSHVAWADIRVCWGPGLSQKVPDLMYFESGKNSFTKYKEDATDLKDPETGKTIYKPRGYLSDKLNALYTKAIAAKVAEERAKREEVIQTSNSDLIPF
jgi:hypothetical protein